MEEKVLVALETHLTHQNSRLLLPKNFVQVLVPHYSNGEAEQMESFLTNYYIYGTEMVPCILGKNGPHIAYFSTAG